MNKNVEKDIEACKKVIDDVINAADKGMDAATDNIVDKLHLNK